MLKLERFSSSEIQIALRDRDSLFSRQLLMAFAITMAMHICALLIFHVTPIKMRFFDTVHPPAQVEADLNLQDSGGQIVADAQQERRHSHYNFEPKEKFPLLPALSATSEKLEDRSVQFLATNPFLTLEREIFQPELFPVKQLELAGVRIFLSQNLALKVAANFPVPFPDVKGPLRLTFQVQIDSQGKIFWISQMEKHIPQAIQEYAQKMLLDLKFRNERQQPLMVGELELHFQGEA